MKRRRLVVVGIAVAGVALVAIAALMFTDVLPSPLGREISRQDAQVKADAYIAENYPVLKDSPVYTSEDDAGLSVWQFGYRTEMPVEGSDEMYPFIVIIVVDKESGALDVSVSN